MLLLEADYAILLTMAANLLRLQLTNLDIADILGLLNPANWNLGSLFHIWEQSQIVIKPRHFGDSVAPARPGGRQYPNEHLRRCRADPRGR
jgi:hypothetical protein